MGDRCYWLDECEENVCWWYLKFGVMCKFWDDETHTCNASDADLITEEEFELEMGELSRG